MKKIILSLVFGFGVMFLMSTPLYALAVDVATFEGHIYVGGKLVTGPEFWVVDGAGNGYGLRAVGINGLYGTGSLVGVEGSGETYGIYGHVPAAAYPGTYGVYGTGGQIAGRFVTDTNIGIGVYGEGQLCGIVGKGNVGPGVKGISEADNPDAIGVHGKGPWGVVGETTTNVIGVLGKASTSGIGVEGQSETGWGVSAMSDSGTALNAESTSGNGIRGISGSGGDSNDAGVYGGSTNGKGVWGGSTNDIGVYGYATGDGCGVKGESTNGYGVWGSSGITAKAGVYGDGKIGVVGKGELVRGGIFGTTKSNYPEPGYSDFGVCGESTDGTGVVADSVNHYALRAYNTSTTKPTAYIKNYASGGYALELRYVMRLVPTSTPPVNPTEGMLYYDSGLNKLRCHDGSNWKNLW